MGADEDERKEGEPDLPGSPVAQPGAADRGRKRPAPRLQVPTGNPMRWSPQEVSDWVTSLGERFEDYSEVLVDNEVSGQQLIDGILDKDDLVEIGITIRTHAKQIIWKIKEIYGQFNGH